MIKRAAMALALCLSLPAVGVGQAVSDSTQAEQEGDEAPPPGPANAGAVYEGDRGQLDVAVPQLQEGEVRVDGRLDEAVWTRAAFLSGFTQYQPVEGRAASEPTRVRVFYTDEALYLGIEALDSEPDRILARLGERDQTARVDDWVRVMLDTFADQRQAYVFIVNPLGLQTDGLWIEGRQPQRGGGGGGGASVDLSPDFIWESDGRVTAQGWEAEIRIPYVSLRFREVPEQAWGINVVREVKRKGFHQSWAPLTQDVPSTLAQSGRLVGLRDLRPRRLMELNPVVTGKRQGELNDDDLFRRGSFEPEIGLNARYGLSRNLILDATVNPDFSQVEADADRVTLNERFAIFFPEKRSFFLEGAEVFQTFQRLVHTRRIVDPVGGAKLTGKVGPFQVGYLGAVDESPRTLDGASGSAVFNLLRIRGDLGTGSTAGLLYTDRTLTAGGNNRVVSGDLRLLFAGRYTFTSQLTGSWTEADSMDGGLKPMVSVEMERSGRALGWRLKVEDVHPGFRASSGFVNRVGDAEANGEVTWNHYGPPGALLERVRLQLGMNGFFGHDEIWQGESPFESEVELRPTFQFRGDRSVSLILRDGYFRFQEEDYESYAVLRPDGSTDAFRPPPLRHMKAVALLPRMRISDAVDFSGYFFLREVPLFVEASRGKELMLRPNLTLRPTDALAISLSHTFSRLWRTRDESLFSTTHISRLRAQYQFSKALFARAIVQYDLEERAELLDPTSGFPLLVDGAPQPASREGTALGQFLLSYEPSPGTIFFVGYSRQEEGEYGYRLSRMEPTADGLFLKLSYLFRI